MQEAIDNNITLGTQSWVEYLKLVLRSLILLVFLSLILLIPENIISFKYALSIIIVIFLIHTTYDFLVVRSLKFFMNNNGIWATSGILPWKKQSIVVLWRDLENASYSSNFLSWMCRSHDIHLSNRHTKQAEFGVPNISNASKVVTTINSEHRKRFGDKS